MALEHLDMDSLSMLQEVMGDEFAQLIDTFVSDSDLRVVSIREAVEAADPEATRRAAHSLKGSASNMGATVLTQLCRQLEELGHEGRVDGALELIEDISNEYAAVKDALHAL